MEIRAGKDGSAGPFCRVGEEVTGEGERSRALTYGFLAMAEHQGGGWEDGKLGRVARGASWYEQGHATHQVAVQ